MRRNGTVGPRCLSAAVCLLAVLPGASSARALLTAELQQESVLRAELAKLGIK